MRLLGLKLAGVDGTDDIRKLDEVHRLGWGPAAVEVYQALPHIDGFILKNPGGVLSNEAMQLTQFAQAKRAGLNWITDNFVSVWKPVCDAYRAAGKDCIAYIGGNPETDNLWNHTPKGAQGQLFKDSFNELAFAGFSFALDDFHTLKGPNKAASLAMFHHLCGIQTLANIFRRDGSTQVPDPKMWVESYPDPIDDWANTERVGTMLSNFNASFKWQDSRLMDNLSDFHGEVVVLIDDDRDEQCEPRGWVDPRWILDDLRKCRGLGWSAAVPLDTGIAWDEMRAALSGVQS